MRKIRIFVHTHRPKVSVSAIRKVIHRSGVNYSNKCPDIAIIVGGDGSFSYYGRKLDIPMLFVGVEDLPILGSKARLAEIFFHHLHEALVDIKAGNFTIEEKRLFSIKINGHKIYHVLTDIYLERGVFSGCIRYAVSINNTENFSSKKFTDLAIGNGVIVSTSFGAGGYYSYPSRVISSKHITKNNTIFPDNRLGICHILPTFLVRKEIKGKDDDDKNNNYIHRKKFIQYTVPFNSIIQINLIRQADVRLYGISEDSKGIRIGSKDKITIGPSNRTAKIIRLNKNKKKNYN